MPKYSLRQTVDQITFIVLIIVACLILIFFSDLYEKQEVLSAVVQNGRNITFRSNFSRIHSNLMKNLTIHANVSTYMNVLKNTQGNKDIIRSRIRTKPTVDNFVLEFTKIITWEVIFQSFVDSINKAAITGTYNESKTYEIEFPGVIIQNIPCPIDNCRDLDISFQPLEIREIGGICGLDFSPAEVNGTLARLFTLPQLPGYETIHPLFIILFCNLNVFFTLKV